VQLFGGGVDDDLGDDTREGADLQAGRQES
jgi:hypothetical protein